MSMKGKIVGVLVGFLGGPVGAVFGGIIGHFLDTALDEKKTKAEDLHWLSERGIGKRESQIVFVSTVIALSVAAISAKDHHRQSKIAAIKAFVIDNVHLSKSEDVQIVERVVDDTFQNKNRLDIESLCASYKVVSNNEGRVLLIRFLFRLCSEADYVPSEEETRIHLIALLLGVQESEYNRIKQEYSAARDAAYTILGVPPSAQNSEIKIAYRQLVSRFHPDRMASFGEEPVKLAEEKFKTIQDAYNTIRQERGF